MDATALTPTIAAYIVATADPVYVNAQLALPLLTQTAERIRKEHRGQGVVLFFVPDTRALHPSLDLSYQNNGVKITIVWDTSETVNTQAWQALSVAFEVIVASVETAVGLLRHPLVQVRVFQSLSFRTRLLEGHGPTFCTLVSLPPLMTVPCGWSNTYTIGSSEANGEFVMEAAHFTLVVRFNLKDNDLDAYVRSRSRTRDQTKDIVVLRSCSNISHPKPHVGLQLAPAGSGAVGTAFLKLLVSLDLFVRDLTKDQHVLTQDKDKKLANKALLVKSNHVQTAKTALGQAYLEGFLEDTLMEVGHLVNPFQSISSWEDFAVLYDSVKTRVPGHSLSPGIRWFEDLQAVEYAIG
ncbi:hypothetical protein BC939DRAFT_491599 [Gamsiella multidivaricata]|uniref:uncharacterized protein n=1 Tax=Gamsiella multidivaricata TaxID=101098 RepID=UPI00221FE6CA|nr:uncharacterized protein BC939DRAFT_491599 [Gamsiella multidivaricata]KAI7826924.1 hypothetical protein BC939DRAFT_491599 [Gamsiella multidivaricata]